MRLALFLTVMLAGTLTGCSREDIPIAEQYPPPWSEETDLSVAKALVKNNIHGCGQMKQRKAKDSKSEYLVYCTRDGDNWTAYIVFGASGDVMGPYPPDPSLQ